MGYDTYDPIQPVPKYFNFYLRWVMNNSDVITSPSKEMAKHAINQGCQKKIKIIPHGTNLSKFNHLEENDKKAIRSKLGIPEDHIVLLAVQRLTEKKGLQYLLMAAKRIIDKNNLVFLICGSGQREKRLRISARLMN